VSEESQVIYAAGAVLWRQVGKKKLELAIIHRPRYDDWSLPKGKLDPNETMIGCAYREVMEETGYTPVFGPEIGDVTYEVDGVKKIVKYWSAQAIGAPTGTTDLQEVDQLLWLSPADAKKKLTLEDDKSLVDFFLEFNSGTTPLVLLRHAKAVKMEIAHLHNLVNYKPSECYHCICHITSPRFTHPMPSVALKPLTQWLAH
jgi:8-oxo-dGTP diphosphatase